MYIDQTKPKIPAWLRKRLLPYFKPSWSAILPSTKRYLLLHPVGFEIWYRLRVARYLLKNKLGLTKNGRSEELMKNSTHLNAVVDHNFERRWLFSRQRTEKLMSLLHCIGVMGPDAKVLCIGPRNEAEILLLSLYGFKLKNIVGIDLFPAGETVKPMDMHDIKFPDNSFDVVYSSWVLKYSYDLQKACREMIRVTKPGGLIAVGYTQTIDTSYLVTPGSELAGGLTELFGHFQSHVAHIYWQEADPSPPPVGNHRITALFSIKK